jgi:hypothetical protein
MNDSAAAPPRDPNLRWAWHQLEDALRELRFGSVTLLVQDGRIVQVERIDRRRYQRGVTDRTAATS